MYLRSQEGSIYGQSASILLNTIFFFQLLKCWENNAPDTVKGRAFSSYRKKGCEKVGSLPFICYSVLYLTNVRYFVYKFW